MSHLSATEGKKVLGGGGVWNEAGKMVFPAGSWQETAGTSAGFKEDSMKGVLKRCGQGQQAMWGLQGPDTGGCHSPLTPSPSGKVRSWGDEPVKAVSRKRGRGAPGQ